ncbi:unnamed protein product [Musa acuminata subsp. malaccensis]|uniref:Photosystem I reaction center subunit VI n=1 Tax=Musa acuminata subsp. malaccensis TaxID=214687 RepID=A0A8D7AZM1_MUSAM|nr:unnamed protein product [Musa acuminata subsp. malaccensis]
MASLTAVAAVQPVAVKGLAGSSFNGKKLALKPSRRARPSCQPQVYRRGCKVR